MSCDDAGRVGIFGTWLHQDRRLQRVGIVSRACVRGCQTRRNGHTVLGRGVVFVAP